MRDIDFFFLISCNHLYVVNWMLDTFNVPYSFTFLPIISTSIQVPNGILASSILITFHALQISLLPLKIISQNSGNLAKLYVQGDRSVQKKKIQNIIGQDTPVLCILQQVSLGVHRTSLVIVFHQGFLVVVFRQVSLMAV